MVFYHLFSTQYLLVGPIEHSNIHLAFAMVLVFLGALQKSLKFWLMMLLFAALSLAATCYVHFLYDDIFQRRGAFTTMDVIVGGILVVLSIEATRQAYGLVLPVFSVLLIGYVIIGYHIIGASHSAVFAVREVIARLSVSFNGIYDMALAYSADYIFLFIIFGALLGILRGTDFFVQFGKLAGAKLQGGPGMTAMTATAAMGMISGSVMACVAAIGPFTIPLMKKAGHKADQAAGIVAMAATGSQIMPPVMGIAAFLMAGLTGISYASICLAAIIPALFFYYGGALYVQLEAMKHGVGVISEKVEGREIFLSMPQFILPVGTLIFFLAKGYTPIFAVFWSLVSLVAVSMVRAKNRPSLAGWIHGLTEGAISGAQIGVSCACVGLITTSISISGLDMTISTAITSWSGSQLVPALVIVMIVTLLLGCGLPTLQAYLVVTILGGQTLINLGLSVLQAHFYIFYFACVSMITPPVGLGSLVASRLAGGSYFKTGWEAVKASISGFTLPFVIAYSPIIIMQPQEPLSAVMDIIFVFLIVSSTQIALSRYFLANLGLLETIAMGGAALLILIYFTTRNFTYLAVAIAMILIMLIAQLRERKARRVQLRSRLL